MENEIEIYRNVIKINNNFILIFVNRNSLIVCYLIIIQIPFNYKTDILYNY